MPKIIADHHIHTALCGHAKGEPKEYVETAIERGLQEIGFSDHAPLFSHRDATITMDHNELPLYHQMIEEVREAYKDRIKVKVGIEADFMRGHEEKTKALLDAYPYDYVIGSIHFIDKWGFDDPIQLQEWDKKDVNSVYHEYYKLLRESAASKMFDVLGHVDLVKKFDFRPTQDMTKDIEENARVIKDSGTAIEVNTSGIHKPAHEIYPSLEALKIYCQAGVIITFGSDAHTPDQVGRSFDEGRQWALDAGYKEYAVFESGKISKMVEL